MLLKNQKVTITCTNKNIDWYSKLGYITALHKKILVNVEDLCRGSNIKVKVKCDYCGKIIDVRWRDYCKYKDNKYSCKSCRQKKTSEFNLQKRQDYLYNSAMNFCNEKGYNLITKKEEILNSNTLVKCECLKHGIFETKIYALVLKHGCKKCAYEENGNNRKLSTEEVIEKVVSFNGKIINPEEYIGWDEYNLKFICPICGNIFTTSIHQFIRDKGMICDNCRNTESKGEQMIRLFLDEYNIPYQQEYRFDDCRDKYPLPFDFYLENLNTCIEFQGRQHYEPIEYFGGKNGLKIRVLHDAIKKNYCYANKINFLEITYKDFDIIPDILKKDLKIN